MYGGLSVRAEESDIDVPPRTPPHSRPRSFPAATPPPENPRNSQLEVTFQLRTACCGLHRADLSRGGERAPGSAVSVRAGFLYAPNCRPLTVLLMPAASITGVSITVLGFTAAWVKHSLLSCDKTKTVFNPKSSAAA
ncbi:hypothetical protein SKAU_G00351190 [Synaphobranchus kaupii]|uniref:Uncharacterized protein n=1 Tax=Synaphobranchus kaupii TaxID=118154 RepID=A0A9Q1II66_SYNKA|nr:hypothetical protein SKAU_G00351190 [Synaphobranchus kaupii]